MGRVYHVSYDTRHVMHTILWIGHDELVQLTSLFTFYSR